MRVVKVNNELEMIGNDRDILDVIEKNCGIDFRYEVENRLNKPTEITNELIEEVLESNDFYSHINKLDDNDCAFNDILVECENQLEYIENAKNISRDELQSGFELIADIVNKQI